MKQSDLPTPSQLEDLYTLSRSNFLRRYSVTKWRWSEWRHQYPTPSTSPTFSYDPVWSDDRPQPTGGETLYNAIATHAEAQRTSNNDQTLLSVDWDDKPVGLLFSADWHVGSQWCDYRQLERDMRDIGQFRNAHPEALHLGHLGDLFDGYLPNMGAVSGGMFEETETNIDRQLEAVKYVAKLAGPWDFFLLGCHPAWQKSRTGMDPLRALVGELGGTNGGFGLELDIRVAHEHYHVLARHKTGRESRLNTTNAQRAMDDDLGPAGARADVVALAHLHNPDLQVRRKAGRRVVYLRSGAYKGGDDYARFIGATTHTGANIGNPLVIFLPDRHHVLAFPGEDWQVGLDVLAQLRGQA